MMLWIMSGTFLLPHLNRENLLSLSELFCIIADTTHFSQLCYSLSNSNDCCNVFTMSFPVTLILSIKQQSYLVQTFTSHFLEKFAWQEVDVQVGFIRLQQMVSTKIRELIQSLDHHKRYLSLNNNNTILLIINQSCKQQQNKQCGINIPVEH